MIALWDLGNVVVQWNPDRILQLLDLSGDMSEDKKELLRRLFNGGDLWLDLDRGITDEASVADEIASQSNFEAVELLQCFETVRESLVDLPKSVALIQEMHSVGIPLYILSNMSNVNAQYLRVRPYFNLFDGIVFSAEEQLIKPDTAVFQRVLDRYKLAAKDVVFIDDSLANIKAAESLGMHGVHFKQTDQCYASVRRYFPKLG